jgi:DNA-binding response OmpR family regulator
LLIIEDDLSIRQSLERSLRGRGHDVRSAANATDALLSFSIEGPDAIVLDLGLPDMEGIEVLRRVRAMSHVPVIVATARDEEADIITTLDAGADDYVVKPFTTDQLEARLRAVMRRTAVDRSGPMAVGPLHVDGAAREAVLDGRLLDLSRKEFDLLAYLAARPGLVVSKRELATEIWGGAYASSDKTVDVHLSWLRRKLGETAAEPRLLRAVRGVGVKLVDPGS